MKTEKRSFLLTLLQEAINEAVAESDRVGELVAEIKEGGYDVMLLLESTVAVSPTRDDQRDAVPEPRLFFRGEMELTAEDVTFLQEMNIAVEV